MVTPIGEGGMGQAWKARDTRLGRTVAIKVSKTSFSERFERQARAVAVSRGALAFAGLGADSIDGDVD